MESNYMREKKDPNANHSWCFGRWVLMALWALVFNMLVAQVPTEGLVGYWPFNGNANDMSGNGNHGILEGESQLPQQTSDRFGNPNSAYQFGGYYNKNWIRVPHNSSMLLDSQMTVSFWFQQCEFAGMDGWGNYSTNNAGFTIFSKAGDGHAAYPGLWVHEGVNFQTGVLNINSSNCNMDAHVATNYDINLEYHCFDTCEWVHFVSIIDDTIAKIYLNGILYRDTIINHADYTKANLQDIFIGRMGCNGFVWFPFYGKIDDVLFYNRAITEDEVLQLFGNFYDIHAFDNQIIIDSLFVHYACNGNDGITMVFPDTANGPYQYALDYPSNFQSSNVLQNISSGIHRVYIKSPCGLKDTLVDFTCLSPAFPDNVDSADCTVASLGQDWGIDLDWSSAEMVSPLVIPLVGDIDGDEVPEIICFAPNQTYNFYGVTEVKVYNTITHQVIHTIDLPYRVCTFDASPYGIIKLPNGHVIFVVTMMNNSMQAYDLTAFDTEPLWTSSTPYDAPNIGFADFNSDTYPEIYVGNRIYDAETGSLLAHGPAGSNEGLSYGHAGEHKLPSPCVPMWPEISNRT